MSSCAALKKSKLIKAVRNHEPELSQPELVVSGIMAGINEEKTTSARSQSTILTWLPRLLAAACIGLLITFSFEQYMVVKKVSKLEKQLATVQFQETNSVGFEINYITQTNIDLAVKNMTPFELIKNWKSFRKDFIEANEGYKDTDRYESGFIKKIISNRSKAVLNIIQN